MPKRPQRDTTPNLRFYSRVLDFVSKENADKYIAHGWELIEVLKKPRSRVIIGYRVGWVRGWGDPDEPPVTDETPTVVPVPDIE